jgi:hypothetical protein
MATKKEPLDAIEEVDTPELTNPSPLITPLIDALPRLKSDRRKSLVDILVASILAGQKLDLDGKMPNQEQRNKIVNFAIKLADDVIAATN